MKTKTPPLSLECSLSIPTFIILLLSFFQYFSFIVPKLIKFLVSSWHSQAWEGDWSKWNNIRLFKTLKHEYFFDIN
ncbi:hypothetical protein AAZX31_10G062700 [Glycine max]